DRAGLGEVVPVVPQPFAMVDQVHFLRDVGGAGARDPVADADEHDAGGEAVGVVGRAPGGRIAAVAAAGDADFLFIDKAHLDEMIDAVYQVLELLAAGVGLPHLGEFDTAAGGAAIVGIEDGHPARGGDLAESVVVRDPA